LYHDAPKNAVDRGVVNIHLKAFNLLYNYYRLEGKKEGMGG
jgi:hypothetical protein